MISLALLFAALICFILAAVIVNSPINLQLVAAGLALWVASLFGGPPMTAQAVIRLVRCPHWFDALSIDYGNTGTRITSGKCCGRWEIVREWPMSADSLRDAAREFQCIAEQIEDP